VRSRTAVRATVGTAVRATVRATVGTTVRAAIGTTVCTTVGTTVCAAVGTSVVTGARAAISGTMGATVGTAVRATIAEGVHLFVAHGCPFSEAARLSPADEYYVPACDPASHSARPHRRTRDTMPPAEGGNPGHRATTLAIGRKVFAVNFEKVVFGFFVVLAATLNFGFFIGPIDDPAVHNEWELFAAVVVNLIALVMKFGDRTQIGAIHLATSLVASLQLVAAAALWAIFTNVSDGPLNTEQISSVVSLSGGALLANIISVTLLVIETVSFRRQ
jgi:hypothetical protein